MAQTSPEDVHLETVEENKDKDTEPMQTRYGFPPGCAMRKYKTRLLADSRILTCYITNEKLAKDGYYDLPSQYERWRAKHLNV